MGALRRRFALTLLAILALVPALHIVSHTAPARRDIVYWDEFDTALAMLLRVREDPSPQRVLGELFAVNNEHRMVTSRALFLASYALTGSVNFVFVNVVGNATLLGLLALLLVHARTAERRALLAVILAALFFQLQHYENFLWSGASIDHFQVVLLAAAALVCLTRHTLRATLAGAAFATLATFTLAHGTVTWVAGAALLWRLGHRRPLLLWLGLGAVVAAAFLYHFQLNRSQGFATASGEGALLVLRYWLTLLGALPAFGHAALAPWFGGALLVLLGWLATRDPLRHEPAFAALILFAVGALALIAIGRAQLAGGVIFSRYYVLGGLAWGLTLFLVARPFITYSRPLRPAAWLVGPLALFNLAANVAYAAAAEAWIECRDRAAVSYLRHGEDGRGTLHLHPAPAHSTALLAAAARTGLYRLPAVCRPLHFPGTAKPSTRLAYFVDTMTVSPTSVFVTGWAALQGEVSRRHKVYLVLASPTGRLLFSTVTESRPDVATATQQPDWALAGFQFVQLREQLPPGDYQVGFLIDGPYGPEFTLTAHRLDLTGPGRALLATGN
jgi:hypothetical protein